MEEHIRGDANANLVLVEYADFECPYCAMAYPFVKRALHGFADDLCHVFRPFPLTEIHPHAMHAAQAAEAAARQDRFWPMHDVLFEHREKLDDGNLWSYAEGLHLDLDRFERDFGSPDTINRIAAFVQQGIDDGVQGTPTFFLNGEMLMLERYDDLDLLISQKLARASRL